MVHMLAACVFVGVFLGGIALVAFMIATRLDAIVAALDPLPETTRVVFVRPATRPAMFRTAALRRPLPRLRAAA